MYTFYILLFITSAAAIFGVVEFIRHQKRIYSIPIRIHINGTRGKSSVTRLVGAGLREGNITTITKVTGTFPRLILDDGSETYIHRKSDANILEQLSIVKFASHKNAEALVMECMALQPQFQWITENQMIHANVGVMTNVRLDHVDIMGHTLSEIAETLGKTIPKNEHLFTSENVIPEKLKKIADKKKSEIHFIEADNVSRKEMRGFSYIEHRDNVALALEVCRHVGIERETALKGMYKAIPDSGALRRYVVDAFNKQISFYNAFAANDPDSTLMIWHIIKNEIGIDGASIFLLNTRHDRLDRARQLTDMVGRKLSEDIDFLILIGESTEVVKNMAAGYGFPLKKIISLGLSTPENVYSKVLSVTDKQSTIVAIGNMGGMGAETAEFFKQRSL